jgi:hypothetical protein
MKLARSALAKLPRCSAKSKQSGESCKNPGLGAGGKCRFHGGVSTGRPPIHGRNTKEYLINRDWLRLLLGAIAWKESGFKVNWFNPGAMTYERAQQVLAIKLSQAALNSKAT